ncbi:hypothetical protein L6273_00395, partial [Candidatus Parcubacteria bacterium]|nr:hypothetical protein [Candidatus Parcubacteria bacterium]
NLRYAIRVSKGEALKCPDGVRLSILIRLKDDLESLGFKWQSKTLNYHIHRFQRTHNDLQACHKAGLTNTKREKKVSKKTGGDVLVWYKNIP